MTGKKMLLSQLCYYERYGLSACSVDPFVEELAENGIVSLGQLPIW